MNFSAYDKDEAGTHDHYYSYINEITYDGSIDFSEFLEQRMQASGIIQSSPTESSANSLDNEFKVEEGDSNKKKSKKSWKNILFFWRKSNKKNNNAASSTKGFNGFKFPKTENRSFSGPLTTRSKPRSSFSLPTTGALAGCFTCKRAWEQEAPYKFLGEDDQEYKVKRVRPLYKS